MQTHTIVQLLLLAMRQQDAKQRPAGPILVTAQAHSAVDNIMRKLITTIAADAQSHHNPAVVASPAAASQPAQLLDLQAVEPTDCQLVDERKANGQADSDMGLADSLIVSESNRFLRVGEPGSVSKELQQHCLEMTKGKSVFPVQTCLVSPLFVQLAWLTGKGCHSMQGAC